MSVKNRMIEEEMKRVGIEYAEADDDFRPTLFYKDDNGNLQPIWDVVILSPEDHDKFEQECEDRRIEQQIEDELIERDMKRQDDEIKRKAK
jgi:hypothetical protein